MAVKILIADASKLHALSLKTRLESLGAEALLASNKAELEALLHSGFELAIADSILPQSPDSGHFALLKGAGKPVYLWCDDAELLADSARLAALGVEKSFRKLNRADLVHETESLLKRLRASSEAPRCFLVVEDSSTVRAYVRRVLLDRFHGSQILEAEDGKAAIEVIKSGRVDLVVTDLQMPGMDGASFVQVLRSDPILAQKPVLILSGMITAKVREEMASLPRLRFLPKPATPEALEEAVRGLLSGEGALA
jgi:two-component system chemotaxis response regulator CheY